MKKIILFSISVVVLSALSGCSDFFGGGSDNNTGGGTSTVVVNSTLTGSITWTADKIYHVTDSVTLTGNLTIQPGTKVSFDTLCGLYVDAGATLSAVGTAASHISFTAAGTQAAGSWGHIVLAAGSNASTFTYCDFTYAGGGIGAALENNGKATITNCVFHDNLSSGIHAGAASGGTTTITGNTFYANGDLPLIINRYCFADSTNQFYKTGSAISYFLNGVEFVGNFDGAVTLDITEVPYCVFNDAGVSYSTSGNLTIQPGVTIKFGTGYGLTIYSGSTFTATGTALAPIVFTSVKDDAAFGDTNGDGATTGAPGDWGRIYLESGTTGTNLKYCDVEFGGWGLGYVINSSGAAAIENCVFTNNLHGAVTADSSASGTLTGNTASDYGSVDAYSISSSATIPTSLTNSPAAVYY